MRVKPSVAAAWTIHALTASGAVLAFFALLAVEQGAFRLARGRWGRWAAGALGGGA